MTVKATAHSEPRGSLGAAPADQLSAVGGRILLADRDAGAYDPALCAHGLVVPETSDGGTQWQLFQGC